MIVMVMTLVSAANVKITEVELNPEGADSGNEWIELYSEDEIDLDGWYLENEDGGVFNLSGSIDGYEVIEFNKQWLDNSEAFVTLYDGDNNEIDETDLLDDSDNDDSTWQLCDGDWDFLDDDTKNDPSSDHDDCDEDEDSGSIAYVPRGNNENQNPEPEVIVEVPQKTINEKIVLNSPIVQESAEEELEITENFISNSEKLRRGVVYFFIAFLAFLVVLISFKKL